jgi:methionine-rich copper-binding protein CopC
MKYFLPAIFIILILQPVPALAHAFPMQQTPGAGAELSEPPGKVSILFDAELEATFFSLRVVDASNHEVNAGTPHLAPDNNRLLETDLKTLGPGNYHVFWSVVSRDGHRTNGDYSFRVNE